jgi:hypothetical protein
LRLPESFERLDVNFHPQPSDGGTGEVEAVFLCFSRDPALGPPITGLTVVRELRREKQFLRKHSGDRRPLPATAPCPDSSSPVFRTVVGLTVPDDGGHHTRALYPDPQVLVWRDSQLQRQLAARLAAQEEKAKPKSDSSARAAPCDVWTAASHPIGPFLSLAIENAGCPIVGLAVTTGSSTAPPPGFIKLGPDLCLPHLKPAAPAVLC